MVQRASLVFLWGISALGGVPVAAGQWAEKLFETKAHDFGTIACGAKAEYEFALTNIYLDDVHVAGAGSSCGCTTVTVKKPLLRTYEQGAILASINSRTFLGDQQATITVTFDKPSYATVQLHVKTYVRSDVVLDPPSVDLGNVDQGTAAEGRVAVTRHGRRDWKILDVESRNPHLSAEVVEATRSKTRVCYELRVRLAEDAPAGRIRDYLTLATNDERSGQIPVLVEGQVLPAISVSPAPLFLGIVRPGQKVTKQVLVRGKKPFRIVSIKADCECFEFGPSPQQAAKSLYVVPVTFTASPQTGKIAKTIRIETDAEQGAAELSAYAVVAAK